MFLIGYLLSFLIGYLLLGRIGSWDWDNNIIGEAKAVMCLYAA
jgi:hypothetical protein